MHSFGSRQLGSLLEGTGAGCIWFDYNNDGLPDLYVVNGRPLDDSMHPYPLKEKPVRPAAQPSLPQRWQRALHRCDGKGRSQSRYVLGGRDRGRLRQRRLCRSAGTGYGKTILYHNDGNGHFTDVTEKAGIKVDGWAISSTWLDYDKDGCVDLFVGRYVKFDPKYRNYYAADNYPGPLDYEGETNKLYHNNCDGTFHRCEREVRHRRVRGPHHGRDRGGLRRRWLGRHLRRQRPHGEFPLPQQA